MKNSNPADDRTTRRILPLACATGLALAFTLSLSQPAHAGDVTPPPVPDQIQVPEGAEPFLVGHARGTQNYVCVPSGAGFAWTLFTPEATLFRGSDKQIITHFFAPNPCEPNTNTRVVANGTIRAAWQYLDTSTVWAAADPAHTATHATDPDFVKEGAVAWLLLTAVGAKDGPSGGDTLSETTFVQRLNTSGGLAPSTGCASLADVGKEAFMPYTADYFFYVGPGEGARCGGN
jgi:Protein of unknown function (DUF3455)